MFIIAIALAASAAGQEIGPSGVPIGKRTRTELAYDNMYVCYVGFMERKDFDSGTPDAKLKRWDKAARGTCAVQIRAYRRRVGGEIFEAEWNDIWNDYSSRD